MENLNFVALDFEWITETGATYPKHITQVGIVSVINGEITERFVTYIKPNCTKKVFDSDKGAKQKTGITFEQLQDAPSFCDVLPLIRQRLNNRLVICHNAKGADLLALFDELERNNFPRKKTKWPSFECICTQTLSKGIWKNKKGHRLENVCERLGIIIDQHHDACCDARCAAEIFIKYQDMLSYNEIETSKIYFDYTYEKGNRKQKSDSNKEPVYKYQPYEMPNWTLIDIPNGLYNVNGQNIILTCFQNDLKICLERILATAGATIQKSMPNRCTNLIIFGGTGTAPKKEELARDLEIEVITSLKDFIESFDLTEEFVDALKLVDQDFKDGSNI